MLPNRAEPKDALLERACEVRTEARASTAVAAVLRSHSRRLQQEAAFGLAVAFLVRQRAEVAVRRRSGLGLVIAGSGRTRDELHGALSRRLGSVFVAADSVAGLGLAISEQPEAVLIDDPLPTMSGLDTSYLVRAYAPGTRVVLFTTDRRSRQLAELNGIFTSTPAISRRQLFKALDEALAA